MSTDKWLIWSIEYNAWWRPKCNGYTNRINDAGIYNTNEAVDIVEQANRFCSNVPNEAMCPWVETAVKPTIDKEYAL